MLRKADSLFSFCHPNKLAKIFVSVRTDPDSTACKQCCNSIFSITVSPLQYVDKKMLIPQSTASLLLGQICLWLCGVVQLQSWSIISKNRSGVS